MLAGKRTTCLPKYMERSAYYLTAWKRDSYLFARRFLARLSSAASGGQRAS